MVEKPQISTYAKALYELIENALIEAGPGASIRSVSESVIRRNPEVVEAHKQEWIIEGVARRAVHVKAQLAAAERSKQIPLPGFERLPMRLTTQYYDVKDVERMRGLTSRIEDRVKDEMEKARAKVVSIRRAG